MTFRPASAAFGPTFAQRVPSLLYLAVALGALGLVLAGERSAPDSELFRVVVEQDAYRYVGLRACVLMLVASAIATVLQAGMRGVRVVGDGLELRELVAFGWPRIRRYRWAQIDRIVLDRASIALDLWDGSRALLPPVSGRSELSLLLERVGYARAIPVKGGVGLDELPEPEPER